MTKLQKLTWWLKKTMKDHIQNFIIRYALIDASRKKEQGVVKCVKKTSTESHFPPRSRCFACHAERNAGGQSHTVRRRICIRTGCYAVPVVWSAISVTSRPAMLNDCIQTVLRGNGASKHEHYEPMFAFPRHKGNVWLKNWYIYIYTPLQLVRPIALRWKDDPDICTNNRLFVTKWREIFSYQLMNIYPLT